MGRILIVEDDEGLASMLAHNLHVEGHVGACARDVPKALRLLASFAPELVLLDLMLPGGDGLEICRELARRPSRPAIIILSARGATHDKVRGLDLGADDYVIKPFLPDELLARVRALLRRSARPLRLVGRELLSVENLLLDTTNRRVFRGGVELHLAQKEFDLLACLMHNRGVALSREVLLEHVWGADFKSDARTVDVHIRWLRAKIETDPAHPRYICTVRGLGYRFAESADELRTAR